MPFGDTLARRLAFGVVACLVAAGTLLAAIVCLLWGGYLVLRPELGPGWAALAVGAVPLALALLGVALAAQSRCRRQPAPSPADRLVEWGLDWVQANPGESVTLALIAGTALGLSADARAGTALALGQALQVPTRRPGA